MQDRVSEVFERILKTEFEMPVSKESFDLVKEKVGELNNVLHSDASDGEKMSEMKEILSELEGVDFRQIDTSDDAVNISLNAWTDIGESISEIRDWITPVGENEDGRSEKSMDEISEATDKLESVSNGDFEVLTKDITNNYSLTNGEQFQKYVADVFEQELKPALSGEGESLFSLASLYYKGLGSEKDSVPQMDQKVVTSLDLYLKDTINGSGSDDTKTFLEKRIDELKPDEKIGERVTNEPALFIDKLKDFAALRDDLASREPSAMDASSAGEGRSLWDEMAETVIDRISPGLENVPSSFAERVAEIGDENAPFVYEKNEDGTYKTNDNGDKIIRAQGDLHAEKGGIIIDRFGITLDGQILGETQNKDLNSVKGELEAYVKVLNGFGENVEGFTRVDSLDVENIYNGICQYGIGDMDNYKDSLERYSNAVCLFYGTDRPDPRGMEAALQSYLDAAGDKADKDNAQIGGIDLKTPMEVEFASSVRGTENNQTPLSANTDQGGDRREIADRAGRAGMHGMSILWNTNTRNADLNKMIEMRNSYIEKSSIFPIYRNNPKYTYLEMKCVFTAYKEGIEIGGKVPRGIDCIYAFNRFYNTNVLEFAAMSFAGFVIDFFSGKLDKTEQDISNDNKRESDSDKSVIQEDKNKNREGAVEPRNNNGLSKDVVDRARDNEGAVKEGKAQRTLEEKRDGFVEKIRSDISKDAAYYKGKMDSGASRNEIRNDKAGKESMGRLRGDVARLVKFYGVEVGSKVASGVIRTEYIKVLGSPESTTDDFRTSYAVRLEKGLHSVNVDGDKKSDNKTKVELDLRDIQDVDKALEFDIDGFALKDSAEQGEAPAQDNDPEEAKDPTGQEEAPLEQDGDLEDAKDPTEQEEAPLEQEDDPEDVKDPAEQEETPLEQDGDFEDAKDPTEQEEEPLEQEDDPEETNDPAGSEETPLEQDGDLEDARDPTEQEEEPLEQEDDPEETNDPVGPEETLLEQDDDPEEAKDPAEQEEEPLEREDDLEEANDPAEQEETSAEQDEHVHDPVEEMERKRDNGEDDVVAEMVSDVPTQESKRDPEGDMQEKVVAATNNFEVEENQDSKEQYEGGKEDTALSNLSDAIDFMIFDGRADTNDFLEYQTGGETVRESIDNGSLNVEDVADLVAGKIEETSGLINQFEVVSATFSDILDLMSSAFHGSDNGQDFLELVSEKTEGLSIDGQEAFDKVSENLVSPSNEMEDNEETTDGNFFNDAVTAHEISESVLEASQSHVVDGVEASMAGEIDAGMEMQGQGVDLQILDPFESQLPEVTISEIDDAEVMPTEETQEITLDDLSGDNLYSSEPQNFEIGNNQSEMVDDQISPDFNEQPTGDFDDEDSVE